MKIIPIVLAVVCLISGCRNKDVDRITTQIELYSINHRAVMSHSEPATKSIAKLEAEISAVARSLPDGYRDRALLFAAARKLNDYVLSLDMIENRYDKMYEKGMLWTPEDQAEADRLADRSRSEIAEIAALLRK